MLARSTRLVAVCSLVPLILGCSSGGDAAPGLNTPSCGSGGSGSNFCVTACNLGCTTSGNCAVNSIAQNQPIELVFNQNVDPSSIRPGSFDLKTASGEAPAGSIEVIDNSVRFVPEVRIVNGVTTFGFRAGEEYLLTLPGGTGERLSVRSDAGDTLERTIACSLTVDLGLIDLNGRPPTPQILTPTDAQRDVPQDTAIVIEFDELIDTSGFQGTTTSSSPIRYLFRRLDRSTGLPDPSTAPILIPGVPLAEPTFGTEPKTRITLIPLIPLPGDVCVEVLVTDQVRDINGSPAPETRFVFYTGSQQADVQTIEETFVGPRRFDSEASSAIWRDGRIAPGTVGGSGVHGAFSIGLLPQDPSGAFVWDTDTTLTIPAARTLLGETDLDIVDARAEFSTFEIPAGQTLRFIGSKPPLIRVSGSSTIRGTIDLSGGEGGEGSGSGIAIGGLFGGDGGTAGPGGSPGGRGADSYIPSLSPGGFTPPTTTQFAENGGDLNAQAASGYAGLVGGTGGEASPLWPVDAMGNPTVVAMNNIIVGFSSQQVSGGGGGGFLTPGGDGSIPARLRIPPEPDDDVPSSPAAGGSAVAFTLPPTGVDAADHFLVGGSGGGGGGSVATLASPTALFLARWINGFGGGGGGGGGAIALRCGRDLTIDPSGVIDLRGGGSPDSTLNTGTARGSSVAGGGSGGSLIIQLGGRLQQDGVIELAGGSGGIYSITSSNNRTGESRGGDGAPGYVRLENAAPTPGQLGIVNGIVVSDQNTGQLASTDRRSLAVSTWYPINSLLPARLLDFELEVTIDDVTTVYTDDPARLNLPNTPGGPVTFKLQGAEVDPNTLEPTGRITPWSNTVAEISSIDTNGIRFLVILDTTATSDIAIERFAFRYER